MANTVKVTISLPSDMLSEIDQGCKEIAPVTTRQRGIPAEVALGPEDGLPLPCVANLDSITTIPKANLRGRVAYLPLLKRLAINDALRFALGLAE